MSKQFLNRHIGLKADDIREMLGVIGCSSIADLVAKTVPKDILNHDKIALADGLTEPEMLDLATKLSEQNQVFKNFIGQGYYGTFLPEVIKRSILQNSGWYSAYTPYQAEISQGRLEMLLNYQQMIIDLTDMDISNASLLDEATAAAEAMMMAKRANKRCKSKRFLVDSGVHPQTINILKTRAKPIDIELIVKDIETNDLSDCFACLWQNPSTNGAIFDLTNKIKIAKENQLMVIVASDLLASTMFKTAGEMGADITIGSSQRFGVPMGFGGPHAAFLACKNDFKRLLPGRLIGVSKDTKNTPALRMSLQTREQHIRRDKATSNICTSQVLLAVLAAAFAIYHGAEGLKNIAETIHKKTAKLADNLASAGFKLASNNFFDTITILISNAEKIFIKAQNAGINLRLLDHKNLTIAIDETTTDEDLELLWQVFSDSKITNNSPQKPPENLLRKTTFLTHPVFNNYHSETEMMRYLKRLENKDIALNHSMIALGSCTMKLNAASEMATISLPGFASLHPFVPPSQIKGYQQLFQDLEQALAIISGYDAVSLQPNAGSQGEFAGLLAISAYHRANNQERDICLIPTSAHGTNPASAVLVGMRVVLVKCDADGNIDFEDLQKKAAEHSQKLAAIMLTYPSTHGVFEAKIKQICTLIHENGGQVYVDGANLNAMVGITKMGDFGADVSHLNLHKTFAIPHGGGGPGVGPIGVKKHLARFLPGDPMLENSGAISAAKFGSASILPISWAYIKMLGGDGLQYCSEVAIVSANYIAAKLQPFFPILYRGEQGFNAHECIIDMRQFKTIGIEVEDIAKRLIDYGFHAPTMSFPIAGTLMIEPTESESKTEIDRFIAAMISIFGELQKVENGEWDEANNPLKNAPHTALEMAQDWHYPYSKMQAFYPLKSLEANKYFPPVKRVDGVYGDKNLFCSCL